jgi:hypothetical protein
MEFHPVDVERSVGNTQQMSLAGVEIPAIM